jgi:tetrapyrrole methylase family protein/MazG family protein
MDAIDEDDDEHMVEECGDLLMNVLFHPIIGEEQGRYDDRDVTTEIVKKLIYRHPHVFGNVHVNSSAEVLKNWDALKQKEKGQQTVTATLRSVPRSFPAMLRCEKVQKKARKVGFDFHAASDAFYKIEEETGELKTAMETGVDIEKEMGDLFFAAMNVCRLLGLDGEETLHKATDKFIRRFEQMEKNIDAAGKKLDGMTLAEMDEYWEKAKVTEFL